MSAARKIPTTLTFLAAMTVLTGLAYPALITAVAQVAFPKQANGSLLVIRGQVAGSSLLSQKFESPRFFRARPSASDYTYLGAGASNLGPTSADLAKAVADRRAAFASEFGVAPAAVPEDMLYASASGLDPDISLASALAQAPRVASARSLGPAGRDALDAAIRGEAERARSLLGPERVNVVLLNALLETDPSFADSGKEGHDAERE
jgi:potassium-transporting ATPase KdpC subunit